MNNKVKRYDFGAPHDLVRMEEPEGSYVEHDDYIKLEKGLWDILELCHKRSPTYNDLAETGGPETQEARKTHAANNLKLLQDIKAIAKELHPTWPHRKD